MPTTSNRGNPGQQPSTPLTRLVANRAWAIFGGLALFLQFFTDLLETPVRTIAALATIAVISVVIARALVWLTIERRGRPANGSTSDRWLAGIAIATVLVTAVDIVVFVLDEKKEAAAPLSCFYEVSGAQVEGAASYPIGPNGSIEQPFRTDYDTITALAVIVGLNDETANMDVNHPLKFELWSEDESVNETVEIDNLTNNSGTRVDFSEPVEVPDDVTLYFKVTNTHRSDEVGVYMKEVDSSDHGAEREPGPLVRGHVGNNQRYRAVGRAVSGCVEGRR